jgi:hypothetical protein
MDVDPPLRRLFTRRVRKVRYQKIAKAIAAALSQNRDHACCAHAENVVPDERRGIEKQKSPCNCWGFL